MPRAGGVPGAVDPDDFGGMRGALASQGAACSVTRSAQRRPRRTVRVYGSDSGTGMIPADDGVSWTYAAPLDIFDFAVSPTDPNIYLPRRQRDSQAASMVGAHGSLVQHPVVGARPGERE